MVFTLAIMVEQPLITYSVLPCGENEFWCPEDRLCVPQCDNIIDCANGSDEQDCPCENITCL